MSEPLSNQNVPHVISNAKADQAMSAEGQWMALQEASLATKLSMATLRRYIKRKRLKWRREGKTTNSKVQVWITPDLMDGPDADRMSTDGFDDILNPDVDALTPEDFVLGEIEDSDQVDQANRETLQWLREKLDDRESKIENLTQKLMESQAKHMDVVQNLNNQLMNANYRNGYLESVQANQEQAIKLLTDTQATKSWWSKLTSWLSGKP
jgi:uncharacterized protein YhaN